MLQHDDQAERDDEAVGRPLQREAEQAALEHVAHQPDRQDRQHHRQREAEAGADGKPGDDAADHQEFAMGEVDDAGQAEDQGDADGDQRDDAGDRKPVEDLLDENVHGSHPLLRQWPE